MCVSLGVNWMRMRTTMSAQGVFSLKQPHLMLKDSCVPGCGVKNLSKVYLPITHNNSSTPLTQTNRRGLLYKTTVTSLLPSTHRLTQKTYVDVPVFMQPLSRSRPPNHVCHLPCANITTPPPSSHHLPPKNFRSPHGAPSSRESSPGSPGPLAVCTRWLSRS